MHTHTHTDRQTETETERLPRARSEPELCPLSKLCEVTVPAVWRKARQFSNRRALVKCVYNKYFSTHGPAQRRIIQRRAIVCQCTQPIHVHVCRREEGECTTAHHANVKVGHERR